jgi:hypothetical protein
MKQTAGISISLTPKPLREVEDYPCVQQKYYVGVAEQTDISNTKPRFGWKTANLKKWARRIRSLRSKFSTNSCMAITVSQVSWSRVMTNPSP